MCVCVELFGLFASRKGGDERPHTYLIKRKKEGLHRFLYAYPHLSTSVRAFPSLFVNHKKRGKGGERETGKNGNFEKKTGRIENMFQ